MSPRRALPGDAAPRNSELVDADEREEEPQDAECCALLRPLPEDQSRNTGRRQVLRTPPVRRRSAVPR